MAQQPSYGQPPMRRDTLSRIYADGSTIPLDDLDKDEGVVGRVIWITRPLRRRHRGIEGKVCSRN
jgi:hypothetical protein